ncbi:MAG: AsmA family protein [Hyphomonadaceae bacterium]|nr:AsmA family protein [Hyphomonadaceae bacterium]
MRRSARPGPQRPRGRSRRRRWTSVVGYGGLAVASIGAAAAAFLLVAPPLDLVRDRLIDEVKARTGRTLAVAGPAALSVFPRPAVSLGDVSLSAPAGINAPPVLSVARIDAELRWWSLLTLQPVVERITLHRPTIALSVDAEGRRSWEAAGLRPRRSAPAGGDDRDARQASAEPRPAGEAKQAALSRLGAGGIRIIDGTLRYSDQVALSHAEIESLNLVLAADDPAGPLKVNGTLTLRGAPLAIAGTVAPLQALLANQPAQLALTISGQPFEAAYAGTLGLAPDVSLDGTLRLQVASARVLGDWLGRSLPGTRDGDAVSLSAGLKVAQGQVALADLQASVGAALLAGTLALDTRVERRRVSGSLQVSELDLGKLLVKPGSGHAAAPSPAPASAPAPDKQGRHRGWSEDPINLSVLGLLDAELALSAGRLIYKDVRTGPGRLVLALDGGIGKIRLEDIELYGGRGRGLLTLDGTGEVLIAGANLKLEGISLQPLLADALDLPWLEGRANVALALAGQGLSERQIVEALNGRVEMAAADGAIVGLDVGKILRSLQRARLPSLTPSPDEKTPFSELAGTFTVTNGVARNRDLRLIGPHLQLGGEGTFELGPRRIDYTMRTKVGGGQPEADATIKVGTLEVPVSIVGPWDKPSFGIKGQEQLIGAVKQIGKNLKSQEVQDAIKGLLQGDGEKRVRPRDLLDKLLKKN